jgi:hypothetical protein
VGVLGKKMREPCSKFGCGVGLDDAECVESLHARLFGKRELDRRSVF